MKPPVRLADNVLVHASLRRPVAMLMILLSMMVLGAIALVRIPLELIPSGFSPPFMAVSVSFPDATAKDVEERITRPLEEALATTPGIERLDSSSSPGGSSVVMVFKAEVDMNIAYRQVRDRVSRARAELPDEVTAVDIHKESGEGIPVAFYGVSWDPELSDPLAVIDRQLVTPIERIDGVGRVNQWGRAEPEVRIEVDRGLADAANLDMVALVQRLAAANFTLASGRVEEGDGQYLLRSVAAWESLGDIENIMVTADGLRLRDIATVVFDRPPTDRYDRYNGRPSMVLAVQKESQANTVALSDQIKAVVDAAREHPDMQGINAESIFIQGDTIRQSLDQVIDAGLQGGLIALAVLLFFLRRVRLTILIALSIPLSLFLSLPVMYFTGQSINLVSLVGLMICIGLVVDNSVVVAENIGRYRRRGLPPYAAALQGAGEVGLAITLATLTTIVVFLPAALLSKGPTQFMMVRLVTPVCVSLAASLFVGLVLIPLASASVLSEPKTPAGTRGLKRWIRLVDHYFKRFLDGTYAFTMGRIARAYERLLAHSLRRRFSVVMFALFALASAGIPANNVSCSAGQNMGSRSLDVNYSMPSDTQLEEADEFFRQLEGQLAGLGPEYGIDGYYIGFDASSGSAQVFFGPPEPDERPFEEAAQELADQLPNRPGWRKRSEFGDSDGASDDSFEIGIFGDEHAAVQDARESLEERLQKIDGVVGIRGKASDTRRREELALSIERGLSERYGVASDVVANTIAYAIRGSRLPRYHTDKGEVDVWVRYREDDREQVDQLLRYRVPTRGGSSIPIGVVADKEIEVGEARLTRTNKRVGAVIRLELDDSRRKETVRRVIAFLEAYQLPEGLSFDAGYEDERINDMQKDLGGAMLLGTIFIFLLMGFLFESFVLPLSVLPSIPLSFVGVWWFLYMTGESIDPLAGIGIVLLLGVVVNNAIVLIDFVNKARETGMSRDAAIMAAGRMRLRPILMTALTTIGGMLPLAFSEHTGEGIPYAAFGKALVGGMTTATILTLIVVPVTYTYLDDLRGAAAQGWLRLRDLGRKR